MDAVVLDDRSGTSGIDVPPEIAAQDLVPRDNSATLWGNSFDVVNRCYGVSK